MRPELWIPLAIAIIVISSAALWYAASKRRDDHDEEENYARCRAMSALAAHLILLGYDVEMTKRHASFGARGVRARLTVDNQDFSPTALLAALKDLPPATTVADDPPSPDSGS